MPVQHNRARSSSDPFGDSNLPALAFKSAPPVPPKTSPTRPAHRRDNTMEAIKDTVTVRNHEPTSARVRVGRSQTQATPQASSNGRTRRSASEDSATKPTPPEKGKKSRSKKGSSHADVIDRMDFSGVGPMFHHDGPFDACAPSRNRFRTKAPMAAWSGAPDSAPDQPPVPRQEYKPPPPVARTYMPEPAPKKKVDAIAEAWGIHEPEPFEDFSAGGGHSNDYRYSPASTISRSSNHVEESRPTRRQPIRKTTLPPPQPIFVPEPSEDASSPPSPPLPGSPGMKRSKSLMHRLRKMRETPNIPVNNGDTINEDPAGPPSPNEATNGATRPTHRSQNSFLGRFGRTANGNGNGREYPGSPEETYTNDPKDKELPRPPQADGENGPAAYFDSPHGSSSSPPSGGGGLGRKQSLLKKVGKVVGI